MQQEGYTALHLFAVDRICKACGEAKPLSAYSPKLNGLQPICKPCASKASSAWGRANRDRARVNENRYRIRHRAKRLARERERYQNRTPEQVQRDRERARRKGERTRSRRLAKERERRASRTADQLERDRARGREEQRRRRLKRNTPCIEYAEILRGDPCSYCGAPTEHVDHIVAMHIGGTNTWDNLTAACRLCNSRKTYRPLLEFLLNR